MLKVANLTVSYGLVRAVRGVSFQLDAGQITCLVGANGAGKSSVLKGVMALQNALGSIEVDGEQIQQLATPGRVERGLALVPEGRRIFGDMTVLDNLRLGYRVTRAKSIDELIEDMFVLFPRLADRRKQKAGTMSGGEQQMLAIGRALMSSPQYLLLDEPTLGLSPIMVDHVGEILQGLRSRGLGLLLAEQNLNFALRIADRGFVLEVGAITASGSASELRSDSSVQEAYLGNA